MKKFARITALMLVVVLSLGLLASCGVSEKTAEKINQAVKDKKSMTYDEVKKEAGGDPTVKIGTTGENATGLLVWINGCKTADEAAKKLDEGKEVKALYVTFALGKAVGAVYQNYDPNKKS